MITDTNQYTDKSFDIAKCRESAESGYAPAQLRLAGCYAEGHGVELDMTEAVRLYKKAATNVTENTGYNGHAVAMRCLVDCYANGDGVRKNAKQAAIWYTKAEDLNNIRQL